MSIKLNYYEQIQIVQDKSCSGQKVIWNEIIHLICIPGYDSPITYLIPLKVNRFNNRDNIYPHCVKMTSCKFLYVVPAKVKASCQGLLFQLFRPSIIVLGTTEVDINRFF